MRSLGWPYPFREKPWADIAARFHDVAQRSTEYQSMADIVDSVIDSGASAQLAGCTSMFDLLVTSRPIQDPPVDVIAVRYAASYRPVPAGHVLIEHLAHTGRSDRILRPSSEAVALFWRFMIEKFGIHPSPTGAPG